MNRFRTYLLMAAMVALVGGIGMLVGGRSGLMIAIVLAAGMNFYAYWFSDTVVLRMHHAREVGSDHLLHQIVAPLAVQAGLPMPRVYLIDQAQPNAFATGRNPEHAAVAATAGLLQVLDRDEIAAVMAHELAHVQNRDTLVMTMTATLAGAISMLGTFALFFGNGNNRPNPLLMILAMVVAPFAAALVQMAISRTREYEADRIGAAISGQPLKLATALDKLQQAAGRIRNPVVERNPAAAALYIVEPRATGVRDNLFGTHPATENRIAALEVLAGARMDTANTQGTASVRRAPSALGLGRNDTGRSQRNPWS